MSKFLKTLTTFTFPGLTKQMTMGILEQVLVMAFLI